MRLRWRPWRGAQVRLRWIPEPASPWLGADLAILLVLVLAALALLHLPFLHLPYFWDEAGYYVPAALDFYRRGLLVPRLTPSEGHTPLLAAYLAGAWSVFGFRPLATRLGMLLMAAATVVATYRLGSRVAGREAGGWAALLLALSPTFFAQSSLAYPSLPVALFTTLAALFALDRRWVAVALTLSLAVLSQETAIVAVPVIWAFLFFRLRERRRKIWALSAVPVILLGLWTLYYHARTGFWTGNSEYLAYNLYAAARPLHVLRAFLGRVAKVFLLGGNWIVTGGAGAGIWLARKRRTAAGPAGDSGQAASGSCWLDFRFLAAGLIGVYILFLSVVGGALLSRYLMPVFPAFYVLAVALLGRLPKRAASALALVAAGGLVGSWFVNPPYPFPYDDNLSYSTFIGLHERAARYLESLPDRPVILTAWPAASELREPYLGYVGHPLKVVPMNDFTAPSFAEPPRFDLLCLYSRDWDPPGNWLGAAPVFRSLARRLGYEPAVSPKALVARFHLKLLKEIREKGQWVRIYAAPPWDSAAEVKRGERPAARPAGYPGSKGRDYFFDP